ncbi:TPA: hypothetical protein N0F65_001845 [Lagenidium giganteum]|uniref:Uncharacterized protein n=1 Tax=Lagenidium giganteum TaxID=4803 RepID=A0AAV2YMZ2_9STRA|nr:TPA: hypothetical protein N0F65_001845 [Lagenidium giganteum]
MDVRIVDQAVSISRYYNGHLTVRADSLCPPERAFIASKKDGKPESSKASKKRKRQQELLDQLMQQGKFVPVDRHVIALLSRAHDEFKHQPSPDLPKIDACDAATPVEQWAVLDSPTGSVQHNPADAPAVTSCATCSSNVFVPAKSRFARADVRHIRKLDLGRHGLITVDPPWENKSVGRGKQYPTFHHTELLNVDVQSVASNDECVLGVWVTNKPLYKTFILDTLLPHWGFHFVSTWYWLKVCVNDELVTPLESTHSLPFEQLIVACRAPSSEKQKALRDRIGERTRVVVSVPLRHSWKPPPECFFGGEVVSADTPKLELFARELRPGWTSVGYEVLKFQHPEFLSAAKDKAAARFNQSQDDHVQHTD